MENKEFFNIFNELKNKLIQNILNLNSRISLEESKSLAFFLLSRIIFIAFMDSHFFPNDPHLVQIFKKSAEKSFNNDDSIFSDLKNLFSKLSKDIPRLKGLFFYKKALFDSLKIDQVILKDIIEFPSRWILGKKITVSTLGHIFENSLKDGEKIIVKYKHGIFYTPIWITNYMVRETIEKWLEERKAFYNIRLDQPEILDYSRNKKIKLDFDLGKENFLKYITALKEITILDPACGSGAFLIEAFDYLVREWNTIKKYNKFKNFELNTECNWTDIDILNHNIFGVDKNLEAVEISKFCLWLKTGKIEELVSLRENIKCGNSYSIDWKREFAKTNDLFDIVVTNPPWGATFTQDEKSVLKKIKMEVISKDSYFYFMKIAMSVCKPDGYISLLLPKSWFNLETASSLRKEIFEEKELIKICSFIGVGFDNILVDFAAVFFKNSGKFNAGKVKYFELDKNMKIFKHNIIFIGENFNILIDSNPKIEQLKKKLKHLEKFQSFADIYSGIKMYEIGKGCPKQTIKDKGKFESYEKSASDWKPLIRGQDITNKYLMNSSIKFIKYGPHLAQKCDEKIFLRNKILLKRSAPDINAVYDDEFLYPVNSLLVIDSENIDLKYLLGVLNSKLINEIYKSEICPINKKYGSEIKTSSIKRLPIKLPEQKQDFERVINLVNGIIENNKCIRKKTLETIYYITQYLNKKEELNLKYIFDNIHNESKILKLLKINTKNEEVKFLEYFKEKKEKISTLRNKIKEYQSRIDNLIFKIYEININDFS